MRAVHLTEAGELVDREIAKPVPAEGEVLVRVRAAGVTQTELGWYPTTHTPAGGKRVGAVPSHEFAGELESGEAVYGMNDWFQNGALAEYCVTRPEWIAPKPRAVSFAMAASLPIGALTAWQGLYDHAKLQAGERVLVHGGAGSVGMFAIQLARRLGAHVITTVSARNVEFARELGADEVIDYKAARFESVGAVDVVFDTVGGETLERSWSLLKPGGRMVTIVSEAKESQGFFIVEPKRDQLVEIARLVDAGELRTFVDAVAPLEKAAEVYAGRVARTGRGKVVVEVVT